jgi:hypothetical protein
MLHKTKGTPELFNFRQKITNLRSTIALNGGEKIYAP